MANRELVQFCDQKGGEQFHPMNGNLFVVDYRRISNKVWREHDSSLFRNEPGKFVNDKQIFERALANRDDSKVVEFAKNYYYDKYVIKVKDVPESYFVTQRWLARERGDGDILITTSMKEQQKKAIIRDQRSSLDYWLDYLIASEVDYPAPVKSWAFHGMLELSKYDKEKKAFVDRVIGTVAPFPELNREALANVADVISKKADIENIQLTDDNPGLQKLLEKENFAKLYASALEKSTFIMGDELLKISEGEWIEYSGKSDYKQLAKSLQGYGTGLCIASERVAESYLEWGNILFYYSKDKIKNGKPIIPRVAIHAIGETISEVRGVVNGENLDPYILDVVKEKINKFSDKESWLKRISDMENLTKLEMKQKNGTEFTRDELMFLYEVNNRIEGFGYGDDPRIKEIKKGRNQRQDFAFVFDCKPGQVAFTKDELKKTAIVFYGNFDLITSQIPSHMTYISCDSYGRGRKNKKSLDLKHAGKCHCVLLDKGKYPIYRNLFDM